MEQNLRNLWDTLVNPKKIRDKKGPEILLEEILAKNIPNLRKDVNAQIAEDQSTLHQQQKPFYLNC